MSASMINPRPDQVSSSALNAEGLDDEDWSGESPDVSEEVTPMPSREGIVAPAQHGQRLDAWLVSLASEFSRNHLKGLIEAGCVRVDGKVIDSPSRKVSSGQRVWVELRPTAQSQAFVPEAMDLPIVFEDEHLLVINKPPGLVVHPAAGHWNGTLMNGLLAHHAGAVNLARAGIVHRLDKDTSGLMVVGKTLEAVTALSRAIADRVVTRQYKALVHGAVPEGFTIDAPIGRDPASRVKMAVVASGKPARTDVRRLCEAEIEEAGPNGPVWRTISGVECTLHTGRTHQIRVHLASRRHPLVADAVYAGAPALDLTRQALHAFRLAFDHPITGQALQFDAPLPKDLAQAWGRLQLVNQSSPTGA
ncbi:MAG: RluA family pseudouridine synthase [Burkholderiales bacterium]|nr:RluA family pseudouridine synthase [Burkholderiales bacterium]